MKHLKLAPIEDNQGGGEAMPTVSVPELDSDFNTLTGQGSIDGAVVEWSGSTDSVVSIAKDTYIIFAIPGGLGFDLFFSALNGYLRSRMPSQIRARDANIGIRA